MNFVECERLVYQSICDNPVLRNEKIESNLPLHRLNLIVSTEHLLFEYGSCHEVEYSNTVLKKCYTML